jgi:hypothetical protein
MISRMFLGSKGRPAHRADSLTAIYEPIVQKMWDPRLLTTLWASTTCYRGSFSFFFYVQHLETLPPLNMCYGFFLFFFWPVRPSGLLPIGIIMKVHILDIWWDGRSARRGAASLREQHNAAIPVLTWLEWHSSSRSQCSSRQKHFPPHTARPLHHLYGWESS